MTQNRMVWTFFLAEAGQGTSRLISRTRYDHSPGLGPSLMYAPALLEPIGGVMDRKMLLGLKARAEAGS